jgi:hypothetical protein
MDPIEVSDRYGRISEFFLNGLDAVKHLHAAETPRIDRLLGGPAGRFIMCAAWWYSQSGWHSRCRRIGARLSGSRLLLLKTKNRKLKTALPSLTGKDF